METGENLSIPEAELRAIPPGRDVVSFHLALDKTGRFVNFKVLTAGGRQEVMLLADRIALHIRDRIRDTLRSAGGADVLATDDTFFQKQPKQEARDWDTGNGHVGVPVGAHVTTFPNKCVIAFPLDDKGTHTAYLMRPLLAAYFLHAINDAEENEDLGRRGGEAAAPEAGERNLH